MKQSKVLLYKQKGTNILWRTSPELCLKMIYFKHRAKWPNFNHPRDISEIILSQICSGEIIKYSEFADKLKAKCHLISWGFEAYLPKTYFIWKNAEEIDFEVLPNSFALKTNNGCGSHYICPDKSQLQREEAIRQINRSLAKKYGEAERLYNNIQPYCYAEEYIDDQRGGGGQPIDYKFLCCDGELRCVLVCSERDNGTKLASYGTDWKKLNWIRKHQLSQNDFEKPENFEKMKDIAKAIAEKFPVVRIDLYSLPNGKIYIGELTFTPNGGFLRNFTNEALRELGRK